MEQVDKNEQGQVDKNSEQSKIDKNEKGQTDKKSDIKNYLLYPFCIVLFTSLWSLSGNIVNKSQTKREKKIELISEFARTSSEYYYYQSVRAMIEFSKRSLIKHYMDSTYSELTFIEPPIEKSMMIQDSIERKYPTAYNLMLEGDRKFPDFQKNLLLSQLFFSETVSKAINTFRQNYTPIENSINKEWYEFISHNEGVRVSEENKIEMRRKIFNNLEKDIESIINLMYNEK